MDGKERSDGMEEVRAAAAPTAAGPATVAARAVADIGRRHRHDEHDQQTGYR
jgi:hypothetical protein